MLYPKAGPLTELRAEFDRCWPWLWASLCTAGPTHNKEQVWSHVCRSKAFLWPGATCVILGEFIDHPIGFRSFNYWLQGGNLKELLTMHEGVEEWAKSKDCQRAVGFGREGWLRVMKGDWQKGVTQRTKWLTTPPKQVLKAREGHETA